MIGSRRRVAAVKDLLISQGADKERLDRIHTPIGLSIGAVTPEEIAISIVAELIACKRLKDPDNSRFRSCSDVDFDVIKTLAGNIDEPISVVTVISSKGSVPRGAGAKMLVYPDGRIVGSIGGGCSEATVIGNAREIIGTGEYRLQTVDMTGDAAENDGMVCGGIMQVLIEDL
jgi:xanthine dehydrogenase accessory factor